MRMLRRGVKQSARSCLIPASLFSYISYDHRHQKSFNVFVEGKEMPISFSFVVSLESAVLDKRQ